MKQVVFCSIKIVIPHFRNDALIISSGISLHAPAIHERISSSDGFFWRTPVVNSWIPSAIHLLLTLSLNGLLKETSNGCRIEVNPPGITAKLVFSLAIAVSRCQSRELRRRPKQVGFFSPIPRIVLLISCCI